MILVLETLECAHKIEFVGILLAETWQYRYFDLALARIRRMIFQYFDSHDIVGAPFPALDHLSECSATQKLKHLQWNGRKQNKNNVSQLKSILNEVSKDTFLNGNRSLLLHTQIPLSLPWHVQGIGITILIERKRNLILKCFFFSFCVLTSLRFFNKMQRNANTCKCARGIGSHCDVGVAFTKHTTNASLNLSVRHCISVFFSFSTQFLRMHFSLSFICFRFIVLGVCMYFVSLVLAASAIIFSKLQIPLFHTVYTTRANTHTQFAILKY